MVEAPSEQIYGLDQARYVQAAELLLRSSGES
jgi:hypothetical protein